MIPKETIDRIYSTLKIEDVIGDYMTLRRRGANLWGNCPFHDEKTPSFSVSPAKGIYKCFGCGKAGNAVNFVMEYEQCSYADALRQVAKKYHIEIQEKELTEEEKLQEDERQSLFAVNDWANHWFQSQLWDTEAGQNIGLSYLMQRGLREDTIRCFQLGYAPDKNALYYAAKKAGYKEEFLIKTGLCGNSQYNNDENNEENKPARPFDRFRDRAIFPIFTISGKVVAFAGRKLNESKQGGKYVNSPESSIYSKSNELYGLFQAKQEISKKEMCYLVEGQMDVISMFQAGVKNVVSSGGTSLTHRQVVLLHRLTGNVTILYDGDSAGIHAALRGIDMLLEEGLSVKVVLLPDGEDPDSFSRKMNAADFQQFLIDNSQDFVLFKTNLVMRDAGNDPIKRVSLIREIVQSISVIPDLIAREVYIKECSAMLGINEDTLLKEVKKLREDRYLKGKKQAAGSPAPTNNITPAAEGEPSALMQDPLPEPKETVSLRLKPKDRLEENILNLLQVLVKYGDYPLFEGSTVGQYILDELNANHIQFEDPLYEKIINEYVAHQADEGFKAEAFFNNHPNSYVSSLARELMSDKYELSRMYGKKRISENVETVVKMPSDADRLNELVPQLIYELQLTIIKGKITNTQLAIQHAQENEREEEITNYIMELEKLKNVEKLLGRLLGNRT